MLKKQIIRILQVRRLYTTLKQPSSLPAEISKSLKEMRKPKTHNASNFDISISELPKLHQILSGSSQCVGCGSVFQVDDEKKPGFIDKKAIDTFLEGQIIKAKVEEVITTKSGFVEQNEINLYEKSKKNALLVCKRCFQLKNYGKMISCDISADDFKEGIMRLKEKKVLIVQIVDLFDLSNSFIPQLNEWVGENPVLLVGNKMDLLPKGVSILRIETWLRRQARLNGLEIVDCCLVSSNGTQMKEFTAKMDRWRGKRDVYIVGSTNVGKSSLLNQFIADQTSTKEKRLTESSMPGTTMKPISYRIGKGHKRSSSFIFDTPGIMNSALPTNYLTPSEWPMVYPTKKLQPVFYRILPGRSIFLGGLGRIDFIENDVKSEWQRIMISVFVSSNLPLHTTSIERAPVIYQKHLGKLIYPPAADNTDLTPMINKVTYTYQSDSRKQAIRDICISGVGWVSITGVGKMIFQVWAPEKLVVSDREPMMPFETWNLDKDAYQDA